MDVFVGFPLKGDCGYISSIVSPITGSWRQSIPRSDTYEVGACMSLLIRRRHGFQIGDHGERLESKAF